MANIRVLLVEDDNNLGLLLQEYLEVKNYTTTLQRDGQAGWEFFQQNEVDFCILDVMLPKLDGFGLAEKIRQINKSTPILFLTAKSLPEDAIHGLKIGADDYMTKPFRMEELLLRIQAILRRTTPKDTEKIPEMEETIFKIGDFTLDYNTQQLSHNTEPVQKLTSKEADLLKLLCQHKNQVLDRTFALKKIWQDDSYFNARSMDVYITKLRKCLKADEHLQILNIHGQGFRLIDTK
jgi:DNA-binding response OmpR family regulator